MTFPAPSTCYFTGQECLGASMTRTMGVRPDTCFFEVEPQTSFAGGTGLLQFTGPHIINFPNAVSGEVMQIPHDDGRPGYRWVVPIYDRRIWWKDKTVSGYFNQRLTNGRLETDSVLNARDMVSHCLDELGETGYDVSNVPQNVYPPAIWNNAAADSELEWLCDLLGFAVVLRISDGAVHIVKLNDTSGADIPTGFELTTTNTRWKTGIVPQTLQVDANPTEIQAELPLVPVIRDRNNGEIQELTGNTEDWPFSWQGVVIGNRYLSWQTAYRWYQPSNFVDGDGVAILDISQVEVLEWNVEQTTDNYLRQIPVPPMVYGEFWPYDNFGSTTSPTAAYPGNYRYIPELYVFEFEYPVFQILQGGAITGANLTAIISYRVRTYDFDDWSRQRESVSVTGGINGTRVLRHPELKKSKINNAAFSTLPSDTSAEVQSEAQVYLTNVERTYDYSRSYDAHLDGIRAIELDGAITQVQHRCGHGLPSWTRVGRFTEFDLHTATQAQQRAESRIRRSENNAPL